MSEISLLKDASFLRQLDLSNIKTFYVKILVLDKNELPLRAIEGRTSTGSITINTNAVIKRAGSVTFLAEEEKNDLTDIDNLLSMNKKIKILVGLENTIDNIHDEIIWFNQGIFVITQPALTHNTSGVTISLQFKDKMCLLNGECGGGLPTSITFDSYDQIIGFQEVDSYPSNPNNYTVYKIDNAHYMWNSTEGWSEVSPERIGEIISVPQKMFDIIQTLVCNYGGEAISKILINDVPHEIKQIVRYTGTDSLYYSTDTSMYTLDSDVAATLPEGTVQPYGYNEDCGYVYTDLTYPGSLISAIGDNVCSVLDKVKNALGNYEYFYDIDGNFVFQEIKNYLNTQYDPVNENKEEKLSSNGLILSAKNYYVDFSNTSSSIYTFEEGSALISSYSNTPSYTNIKNDFHIWGKNENGYAIHYHIVIKEKPIEFGTYSVVAEKNDNGENTGRIHLAAANETGYDYTPKDWRAELYMRGLVKKSLQQRPDIYEQELLDLFDSIYDMQKQEFKADLANHPNDLKYWIDYINPTELYDISVDSVGSKIKSYQQENIKKLYNTDIPNVIIINGGASASTQANLIYKCEEIGQPYSRVVKNIYNNLSIGTYGYTAQEVARDLLYQYTDFTSAISISSIPIYYLDVNNRITIRDRAAGIYGDYVVKTINLPLDARNAMTVSATKALNRD